MLYLKIFLGIIIGAILSYGILGLLFIVPYSSIEQSYPVLLFYLFITLSSILLIYGLDKKGVF